MFTRFLFEPILYSNLAASEGTGYKSCASSSFIIVFVGMFGVSFSKPPCMNMAESTAQTECLKRWSELNLRHSELSVSYTSSWTFSPTLFVRPPRTSIIVPTKMVEC